MDTGNYMANQMSDNIDGSEYLIEQADYDACAVCVKSTKHLLGICQECKTPKEKPVWERVKRGDKISWYNIMLKETRNGTVIRVDSEGIYGRTGEAGSLTFLIHEPCEQHNIKILKEK